MSEIFRDLKRTFENRQYSMERGLLKDVDRQTKIIALQSCRAIDNTINKSYPEKEVSDLLRILKPKEYHNSDSFSRSEAISKLSKIRKELGCR
jgi:hypothetical protein